MTGCDITAVFVKPCFKWSNGTVFPFLLNLISVTELWHNTSTRPDKLQDKPDTTASQHHPGNIDINKNTKTHTKSIKLGFDHNIYVNGYIFVTLILRVYLKWCINGPIHDHPKLIIVCKSQWIRSEFRVTMQACEGGKRARKSFDFPFWFHKLRPSLLNSAVCCDNVWPQRQTQHQKWPLVSSLNRGNQEHRKKHM